MALKLQRPILIGGLGLTVSGWVLNALHPADINLESSLLWGAIALGSGVWWWSRRSRQVAELAEFARPIDRSLVTITLADIETLIQQIAEEQATADPANPNPVALETLRFKLANLTPELSRTQVKLAILGGKSVGKTTLAKHLYASLGNPSAKTDTSLSSSEATTAIESTDGSRADLVLFVVAGDLTHSEYQQVEQVVTRSQRLLLVFNKQDQYLPADRPVILQQLRSHVSELLSSEDVVAIATQPAPTKVRQVQADGSAKEFWEHPTPDLAALQERVKQVLAAEGAQLILNTTYRQAIALKAEALATLNQLRRDRAQPLIDQAQWIAAATAFANPVPSLDLLATAAVNTQLIVDLGAIYHQKVSLDQAKTAATTLAGLMVKLGLVEMTSQAIAPLLKSNALTYVAGGLLQGVSAAYLTRLAGLSLIAYFEEQSQRPQAAPLFPFQSDRLGQVLKTVFQSNQRTAFWQTWVNQGVTKLLPDAPQAS